ncbi:MAG: pyruvate kinase [Bradymonadia bacterium]
MRKTKIIATIGPATSSKEMLSRLFEAGCNVVRINMSHSSQEEAAQIIAAVRSISTRVGILLDTRGPEVRTTEVAEEVELIAGREVKIRGEEGMTTAELVRVNYSGFHRSMEAGGTILLADGRIQLEVLSTAADCLHCQVVVGGTLGSKKGVNVPGVKLPMPFLSEQDISDIQFGVAQKVDFVAASFVSDPEDVLRIRELVAEEGGQVSIISKIEARYAIKNLADIIAVSEGIMVARGDLGVEIAAEEVPVVQKQMIDACRGAGKVVIVATEMMESMIQNPRPTRAETSDVANAVFEGADAIMLSAETSVGAFPTEAVATMARIAQTSEAEVARRQRTWPGDRRAHNISDLVCKGAWLAARELNISAILVPTSTGRTARRMSRYRPSAPILVTTPDMAVARSLALNYAVHALSTRHYGRMENMIRRSCQLMVDAGWINEDNLIAVVCGVPVGRSGNTNLMTLQQVSALLGQQKVDPPV